MKSKPLKLFSHLLLVIAIFLDVAILPIYGCGSCYTNRSKRTNALYISVVRLEELTDMNQISESGIFYNNVLLEDYKEGSIVSWENIINKLEYDGINDIEDLYGYHIAHMYIENLNGNEEYIEVTEENPYTCKSEHNGYIYGYRGSYHLIVVYLPNEAQ